MVSLLATLATLLTVLVTVVIALISLGSANAAKKAAEAAEQNADSTKKTVQLSAIMELLVVYSTPDMRKAMRTIGGWYEAYCDENDWAEKFVDTMREVPLRKQPDYSELEGDRKTELIVKAIKELTSEVIELSSGLKTYDDCRRKFSHYIYRVYKYYKVGILDLDGVRSAASVSVASFATFIIEHLEKALNPVYNVELFEFIESLYLEEKLLEDFTSFHKKRPPLKIRN